MGPAWMDDEFIYLNDDVGDFEELAREIMRYTNYSMDQLETMTAQGLDDVWFEYQNNKSASKNKQFVN